MRFVPLALMPHILRQENVPGPKSLPNPLPNPPTHPIPTTLPCPATETRALQPNPVEDQAHAAQSTRSARTEYAQSTHRARTEHAQSTLRARSEHAQSTTVTVRRFKAKITAYIASARTTQAFFPPPRSETCATVLDTRYCLPPGRNLCHNPGQALDVCEMRSPSGYPTRVPFQDGVEVSFAKQRTGNPTPRRFPG